MRSTTGSSSAGRPRSATVRTSSLCPPLWTGTGGSSPGRRGGRDGPGLWGCADRLGVGSRRHLCRDPETGNEIGGAPDGGNAGRSGRKGGLASSNGGTNSGGFAIGGIRDRLVGRAGDPRRQPGMDAPARGPPGGCHGLRGRARSDFFSPVYYTGFGFLAVPDPGDAPASPVHGAPKPDCLPRNGSLCWRPPPSRIRN